MGFVGPVGGAAGLRTAHLKNSSTSLADHPPELSSGDEGLCHRNVVVRHEHNLQQVAHLRVSVDLQFTEGEWWWGAAQVARESAGGLPCSPQASHTQATHPNTRTNRVCHRRHQLDDALCAAQPTQPTLVVPPPTLSATADTSLMMRLAIS